MTKRKFGSISGVELASGFGNEGLLNLEKELEVLKAELTALEANKEMGWEDYQRRHNELRAKIAEKDKEVRESQKQWGEKTGRENAA